ncbi:MAG: glycosyltransferase family 4 protein [Verrucomicrobiota bacterium]
MSCHPPPTFRSKVKVAILADFPLHTLSVLNPKAEVARGALAQSAPAGHPRSWLVSVQDAYAQIPDLEIHWVVLSHEISAPREVPVGRQVFHLLPTSASGRALTLFRQDRKTIRRCLDAIQPQVVHAWGTEDVYGWAAATSGFPNIVSMQGILSYYVLRNRAYPREYFQALLECYVLRKADLVTVESQWGREVLLRRSPHAKVEVVEYGVQRHFLETPWQPDPEKPVAIFVGGIIPRKGIQDVVAAFRSSALASAELWAVGRGGSWAAKLREEAPTNVKWLGRLSSPETAQLLRRAWCLVLPTRADTSPNVVKEARVIGLPVISTPRGGQTAYIQHGENGFLVEPGDVEGLTKALSTLLSDAARCRAMGDNRHEEHRRLLDPMRTAQSFFELYQQLGRSSP